MKKISSLSNTVVKRTGKLFNDSDYRRKSGLAVVEGFRLVKDAMSAGAEIQWVFLSEELAGEKMEELGLSEIGDTYVAAPAVLKKLSSTATPQGIVAVVHVERRELGTIAAKRLIVLDGVGEPGNAGTLIRGAAAFGFAVAVMPGSVDIFSPKVLRASMGGVFRTPVFFCNSLDELIGFSRSEGLPIWVADNRGGVPVNEARIDDNIIVVLGNEAHGPLSFANREIPGVERITIPMEEGVESLNVAMAGTIIMYESFRRRRTWRC
ncbi:MAG TPA: RNA methyltransferase [Firmicutes bacterium]|nr:RNA methyltransferase [Bacillota bacterium]